MSQPTARRATAIRVTSREPRGWSRIAVLLLAFAAPALAGDPPPPAAPAAVPTPEQMARLRVRVAEWSAARARLVVIERGVKKYDGDVARKVLYDLRSPTWRKRETAREEATAEFRTWSIADAYRLAPRTSTWVRGDPVDAKHALAFIKEGKDGVARASRWILDSEDGAKPDWFLWMESGDGPWPTIPAPAPADPCDSVPEIQGLAIDALLEKAGLQAAVEGRKRCGRTLVVEFTYPDEVQFMAALVADDSIRAIQAIYGSQLAEWDLVQFEFLGTWKNKFGELTKMPVWTTSLDAATFPKIQWKNLNREEAFLLLNPKHTTEREGWKLVPPAPPTPGPK